MTDPQTDLPGWLLQLISRPLLLLLAAVVFFVALPGAVVLYLDQRIAELAHTSDGRPANEPSAASPGRLPDFVLEGQTVYVPLYSHVYQGDGERLLLAGTLSIRNTDLQHPLTISAVRYYDTQGNLVRDFLKTPLSLKPMGSTDFFIRQSDTQGGSGANFLVEWVSDQPVHEPVIEAVMVGHRGNSVATFARPGVVTHQIAPETLAEPEP